MAVDRRTTRGEAGKPRKAKHAKSARPEPPAPLPDGDAILFRHLGDQVAPGRTPGWWWQVEYHDGRDFPCGLAWVLVVPPDVPGREKYTFTEMIWFVLVADDSRRRGVATRLVRACRERWPDAQLTPAISAAGKRLCDNFPEPVVPEDVFSSNEIERLLNSGKSREEIRVLAREAMKALDNFTLSLPPKTADPVARRPTRRKRHGEKATG